MCGEKSVEQVESHGKTKTKRGPESGAYPGRRHQDDQANVQAQNSKARCVQSRQGPGEGCERSLFQEFQAQAIEKMEESK